MDCLTEHGIIVNHGTDSPGRHGERQITHHEIPPFAYVVNQNVIDTCSSESAAPARLVTLGLTVAFCGSKASLWMYSSQTWSPGQRTDSRNSLHGTLAPQDMYSDSPLGTRTSVHWDVKHFLTG